MQVIVGQPVVASLVDTAGSITGLGARLEVPGTRAALTPWQPAALDGAVWTVTVDPPLVGGIYQLAWTSDDDDAPFEAFVPVTVLALDEDAAAPIELVTPTPTQVAALLVMRTGRAIDDDSPATGTFTEHTTPTLSKVQEFIAIATTDVVSRVRVPIPVREAGQARNVAAYWASVLAEMSLVPQGASDEERSVAPGYTEAYEARLTDLAAACRVGFTRLA